jgi:hypothetical protein
VMAFAFVEGCSARGWAYSTESMGVGSCMCCCLGVELGLDEVEVLLSASWVVSTLSSDCVVSTLSSDHVVSTLSSDHVAISLCKFCNG